MRATRPKRVPTVLSVAEVQRIIQALAPGSVVRLVVQLLYGAGLRIGECVTLRVRDIDFDRKQIIVRQTKGNKDRIVMLPQSLRQRLREQIEHVKNVWERDCRRGGGIVPLPVSIAHKCPSAERLLAWQFVFPSATMRYDSRTRAGVRWYLHPATVDREINRACRDAGVLKRVTCHTFRHSFATHLLEQGWDIRQVQTLLGHESVETTMIYTQVMNKPAVAVTSPVDLLETGRQAKSPAPNEATSSVRAGLGNAVFGAEMRV